jgi:hypothetical protein
VASWCFGVDISTGPFMAIFGIRGVSVEVSDVPGGPKVTVGRVVRRRRAFFWSSSACCRFSCANVAMRRSSCSMLLLASRAAERAWNCLLFSVPVVGEHPVPPVANMPEGLVVPGGSWRHMVSGGAVMDALVVLPSYGSQLVRPSWVFRFRYRAGDCRECRLLPAECVLSAHGFPCGLRQQARW